MTIGTCGNCGGRVSVPDAWMGVVPPIPSCDSCGAIPVNPHGPVIPMQRRGATEVRPGTMVAVNLPPDELWEVRLKQMAPDVREALLNGDWDVGMGVEDDG